MKSTNDLNGLLNKENQINGVVPFWFINHFPEEVEIRKQVREMAEKNCKGVMVHPRDGLLGGYLNSHWQKTMEWIIDEAKKQGVKVWLYDELHYPSGPVGGQIFDVCPGTAMQSLELVSESGQKPSETFDKVLEYDGKYLCFNIQYQRQYPDYLNKDDMKEFVRLSYTWYADRFKQDFGTTIPGEFTDNSCANFGYFRRSIPWTGKMPELFREKTGYDLDAVIPSLFLQTENSALHRIIFWRFLNDLYLETFIIPIEEECEKNGIGATGHYCIETGVSEHVRQLGDRFDQKQHQQIPGVDMLGHRTWEGLENFPMNTASAMVAMTSSPAYFLHDSSALCECLGLSMEWAMTLAETRRLTGTLAALGIDIFVPHGVYYSIAEHRKRECVPDFYHNTMWEYFGDWAKWIGKVASLTTHADEHLADIALLYPVTSQQASIEVGVGERWHDQGERCLKIDRLWSATGNLLVKNAIPFEIISEDILSNAKVCGRELQITLPNGNTHKLHTVVLVSSWIIGDKAYAKLQEFAQAGGCILSEGETLSAVFNGKEINAVTPAPDFYAEAYAVDTEEELEKTSFVSTLQKNQTTCRVKLSGGKFSLVKKEWIKDGHYFALIHNFTRNKIENVEILCDFSPVIVNLDSNEQYRAKNTKIVKTFTYGETLLLTDCEGDLPEWTAADAAIPTQVVTIAPDQWNVKMEGPNVLILREMKCQSLLTPATHRLFTWEFEIESMPGSLGLAMELEPTLTEMNNGLHPFARIQQCGGISARCNVEVNGNKVTNFDFGERFDRWICESDITPFIKRGKNIVTLTLGDSLHHQNLAFPEPILITGPFGVVDGKITGPPETLPSPVWHGTSLENYSGKMSYTAKIKIPESMRNKTLELVFHNVREILDVTINGEKTGSRYMTPWRYAIPEKFAGMEELELTLQISNTPANRWQTPLPSGVTGGMELHSF